MITKYDIGDTIVLTGTITSIEQGQSGDILYIVKEYDRPILEETILARIEAPWKLVSK